MMQRQTNVDETGLGKTINRAEARSKALPHTHPVCNTAMVSVQAQGWITELQLHMRLHFRVTELVQCSLLVNRSWHQALGFRCYVFSLSQIW